jgi:hypothetical protein
VGSDGKLHCVAAPPDGGTACVNVDGSCTANADCCYGLTCHIQPGSTNGTCTTIPTYDGGVCSMFGQMCNANEPCCTGLSCYVTGSNPLTACPSGQTTGCSCYTVIP